MSKEESISVQGRVMESLPNTTFKVNLIECAGNLEIIAYLSGKMRKNHIKIIPGDLVTVEISSYDLTKGRITYRQNRS